MRVKHLAVLICLFARFGASALFAQQDIKVVTADTDKKAKIIDKKFLIVSSALFASTFFDAETTFSCIKAGTCREGNPLMQPFFRNGRPAVYGFCAGVNGAFLYSSYCLRKSSNPTVRKLWWVIPVTMTVSHVIIGGANLRFSFK